MTTSSGKTPFSSTRTRRCNLIPLLVFRNTAQGYLVKLKLMVLESMRWSLFKFHSTAFSPIFAIDLETTCLNNTSKAFVGRLAKRLEICEKLIDSNPMALLIASSPMLMLISLSPLCCLSCARTIRNRSFPVVSFLTYRSIPSCLCSNPKIILSESSSNNDIMWILCYPCLPFFSPLF